MKFKGKKVLITGAARGIGLCLAKQLASMGCDLILIDKDIIELENVCLKLSSECTDVDIHYFELDISNYGDICALATRLELRKLIPHILVNNAGIGQQGDLVQTTKTQWDRLIDVNLKGPIYMSKVIGEVMVRKHDVPCIVNVASGQAFFKLPTWGAYTTTKTALGTFSELLGIELMGDVDVVTVYPFMVDTGFYDDVKKQGGSWGSKMAMKLIPYYSNKPETVAKKIVKAIEKRKLVEMVHPLNWVGYYMDTIPLVGGLVRLISYELLRNRG